MKTGCEAYLAGFCLSRPTVEVGEAIFGFSQYLTALALLVLVYNVTDARYRIRIQVAPLPLFTVTFFVMAGVGFCTLLLDLWVREKWLALAWGITPAEIQAGLAIAFLCMTLTWIWFAFLFPAKFGRSNATRFIVTVYHSLMSGRPELLDAVAVELGRSSGSVIRWAGSTPRRPTVLSQWIRQPRKWLVRGEQEAPVVPRMQSLARELLGLLPHRPFCRSLVKQSPATAIILIEEAASTRLFIPEIGHFAHQVSNISLEDTSSLLYQESEYFTGVIGHLQSFRKALYGHHDLIEATGQSSLDIDYRLASKMTGKQVGMFGDCLLTTTIDYLNTSHPGRRSYCIGRALDRLAGVTSDLYTLDQQKAFPSEALEKAQAVIDCLRQMIEAAQNRADEDPRWLSVSLRIHEDKHHARTLYDDICDAIVEVILHSGNLAGPFWTTWTVQHNTIWTLLRFHGNSSRSSASGIVSFKVRRKLYDTIVEMDRFPNYQGARALRFCLNVMGWTGGAATLWKSEAPLQKAVLAWTRRSFAKLYDENSDVANACLTDMMAFDRQNCLLTRRHEKNALHGETVDELRVLRQVVST